MLVIVRWGHIIVQSFCQSSRHPFLVGSKNKLVALVTLTSFCSEKKTRLRSGATVPTPRNQSAVKWSFLTPSLTIILHTENFMKLQRAFWEFGSAFFGERWPRLTLASMGRFLSLLFQKTFEKTNKEVVVSHQIPSKTDNSYFFKKKKDATWLFGIFRKKNIGGLGNIRF